MLAALAVAALAAPGSAEARGPGHCPPGLAKKNPPCVPPGHARRNPDGADRHRGGDGYGAGYRDGYADGYRVAVGDILRRGDYDLIRDPLRYGLPPYRTDAWRYYLVRDLVVRADPETRRVLAIVGLLDALLN